MERKPVVEMVFLPKCDQIVNGKKCAKIGEFRIFTENSNQYICQSCFSKWAEKNDFRWAKNYDFSKNPLKIKSKFFVTNHIKGEKHWRDFGKEDYSVRKSPDILSALTYSCLFVLEKNKDEKKKLIRFSREQKNPSELIIIPAKDEENIEIGFSLLGEIICRIDTKNKEIQIYKQ